MAIKRRKSLDIPHTQNSVKGNSVERPQNRHLKPFKSRAELGGQLDPRINAGGRPKIIAESLTKQLLEEVEPGVPRVEVMTKHMILNACSFEPHSVSAFRAIREIVEPDQEADQGNVDRAMVSEVLRLFFARNITDEAIEV